MQILRQIVSLSPKHALGAAAGTAAIALLGALAGPAWAADTAASASADAGNARYMKDRADCNAGKTAEDRATCLKEAGAAQADRKRHQLDTNGSTSQNAADRCNIVAAKDKADCLARVQGAASNQRVTTSGSVAGGGIIKETTTTTTGPAIVIPVAPAASTPN